LPDLARVRSILQQESLFVVVSDAFLNETGELADVVLPTALWGEKTGAFTNYDRTVHLSEKAVDPPGEARPDLDIFLEYARRLDLRDRDGEPLIKWTTAEEAFDAFGEMTRGRLCDYSGLSHDRLRGSNGFMSSPLSVTISNATCPRADDARAAETTCS
jgi:anaerobic selenocysteine-containing dehydrogenase